MLVSSTRIVIEISYKWKNHLPFGEIGLQQTEISLPLIADYFSASEASNWDDHIEIR